MRQQLDEIDAQIALMRANGVGPVKAGRLLERFDTAAAILYASDRELLAVEGMTVRAVESLRSAGSDDSIASDRRLAEAEGLRLVGLLDPDYPELLKAIYAPPAVLWTAGESFRGYMPSVAIVGTRRPSPAGKSVAYSIAYELARQGYTIVSGLAYGIDEVAHRAALDAGGRTIAVLGSGLRRVYPHRNRQLGRKICEHGSLVSEFPIHMSAQPGHFPRRNRIISGLTTATIVVEAYEGGGALLTAKLALDQDREVFAVPGLIGNPAALGTNQLIQRGEAQIFTGVDGFLRELGGELATTSLEMNGIKATQSEVLDQLSLDPLHIDELSGLTERPTSDLLIELLRLECSGQIRQLPGKYFVLAPA